jgi:predicted aspartyl protease
VITGSITPDGVPVVMLLVAGTSWPAIIDTGFNGDPELPGRLQPFVNARFICRNRSSLAAGQIIEEDTYVVDFPFDGQTSLAEATFADHDEILIGTHLLREYRLEIDIPSQAVRLERVS